MSAVNTYYDQLASAMQAENITNVGNLLDPAFISYSSGRVASTRANYLSQLSTEFSTFTFNSVTISVVNTQPAGSNTVAYVSRSFNVTDGTGNTITTTINTMDTLEPSGSSYLMLDSAVTLRAYAMNGTAWDYATLAYQGPILLQGCGDLD